MPAATLDFSILAPLGFVAVGALLVLLGDAWLSRGTSPVMPWLVILCTASLGLALSTAVTTFALDTAAVFNVRHPMLRVDAFSSFVFVLVGLAALLSVWLSMSHLAALRIEEGEYYALLLLSVAGMFVAVAAIDLMTLFVGVELMCLPLYALAGFDGRSLRSSESGLKFAIMGVLGSAVGLYGMALLYGATGATSFAAIREGFDPDSPLALGGLALVIAGLAVRVAAVPFHQWAPDVEEGAPTAVSGFVSVGVRVTALAALARFGALALPDPLPDLRFVLGALAVGSIVVGTVMALIQTQVKRLLAYGGVAQGGYLLIAAAAGTPEALAALLFGLCAYVFANLGAFGLVAALAHGGREPERLDDYAGLARSRPATAASLTLFLLSLAAFPGTGGFVGRFQLFESALGSGLIGLVGVGALLSVALFGAYLRLPMIMYMREPVGGPPARVDTFAGLALVACAAAVLWLGWFPDLPGLDVARVVRVAAASLVP